MANAFFDAGKKALASGDIAWKLAGGSVIKAVLIDTGVYTKTLTDTSMTPLRSAVVGIDQTLTKVDVTNAGVCDASDVTFSGLTTAPTCEAIVLYKFVTDDAGSTPFLWIDTAASGLPTPALVDSILVQWEAGKVWAL